MSKYFLINGALTGLIGAFANKSELQAAAKGDDDAVVVTNPNDIYEALSEPQMRRIRADVQALRDNAEDRETAGTRLFQTDERFNTKSKKMPQAQRLYDELREAAGDPVVQTVSKKSVDESGVAKPATKPKAARAPRRNIKQHIRSLFPTVDTVVTYDKLTGTGDDAYSDVSVTTALSDLRSEKYCGEGGVLRIKRIKAEDGSVTYKREA